MYNLKEVAHDTNIVYKTMIGYAEQKGSTVYVYSQTGVYLWSKYGTLIGYTSDTVSIKQGSMTYVYDERGVFKFAR